MVERVARALLVLLVGLNIYGLFHAGQRPQDQGAQTLVIFFPGAAGRPFLFQGQAVVDRDFPDLLHACG